jgi:type I restriction enzyme, S subunit
MQKTLPKGWKWVRLGEVCSINPPKPVLKDEEAITFLPMSAISDDGVILEHQTKQYREVKKGYTGFIEKDVLFAKITPCMENGKGAIAKDLVNAVGFGSTEFHVIRAGQDILPELIYRYLSLKRIRKFAEFNMAGSAGQKRVPDIFLKSLKIPLPPLPTQPKIVEILQEADNLRKLRQQADEKMKDLIPSLFVQMFGDPVTNPKGWKVKTLGSTASKEKFSIRMGPFGSQLKKHELVNEGIKVLWIENIVNNKFEWKDNKCITPEKYQYLKGFKVNPKDVLTTTMGTIGRSCFVPDNIGEAIISSHLLKISLDLTITNPEFIAEYLRLPFAENYFLESSHGIVMKGLNTTIIKSLPIYLPPLPLQQEFAKLVDDIEAEKARQAESRKKLDELFNSLMQRAFTGELVS